MKTLTGIRSFQGATEYLTDFVPDLATKNVHIRNLLKQKNALVWNETEQQCFEEVKKILTGNLLLAHFDSDLKTELITDASRVGLGFILWQYHSKIGEWRMVQCGSRAVSETEARYAVCEIEGLAILFALKKCRHYLIGMPHFVILTDHQSLTSVFKKDLCSMENVRLRRYAEKIQEYNFTIIHLQGSKNLFADHLSRYPTSPAEEKEEEEDCICKAMRAPIDASTNQKCGKHISICRVITTQEQDPDPILQKIINAAKEDPEYQQLIEHLSTVMWHTELPKSDPIRKEYADVLMNLSRHKNGLVVLNNERIIIPKSERERLVCEIHKPHAGINGSMRLARRDYYWPGMEKDITKHIATCDQCIKHLASQTKQPIIHQNKSTAPMEVVGVDLFEWKGKQHLVIVDQFSGYIYVQRLATITTLAVKRAMGFFFNLFGNPYWIIQDNGRQLVSNEYKKFLEDRGIHCDPRSPYYPQSNGLAESAVKNSKKLLDKCKGDWAQFDAAMAAWRDVPNACGYTPSEIFLARRTRGTLPILPGKTSLNVPAAEEGAENRKMIRKYAYGKIRSKHMDALNIGQELHVQKTTGKDKGRWLPNEATVTGIHKDGRSYDIVTSTGLNTTRNRRHLRPATEKIEEFPDVEIQPDPIPNNDIIKEHHACDDECETDDESTEEIQNDPEITSPAGETDPVPLRRSARTNKGVKCHSCTGCCSIRNYLQKITQIENQEKEDGEHRNHPETTAHNSH